jgi:flagellar hook-associated protein 2
MDLGIAGLASGFDWKSLVDQLIQVERAPETRMRTEQSNISKVSSAYGTLKTALTTMQTQLAKLKETEFWDTRNSTTSDETVATVESNAGATLGEYKIAIDHLATATKNGGAADIGTSLDSDDDVSDVLLHSAGFATAVTAGTFTINGKQVAITTADNLQAVFDKINSATGGNVMATYDHTADKITLTSLDNTELVMGGANDSSNFLQVAKLYNTGTASSISLGKLGSAQKDATLASARLATAIDDNGGTGSFKINGVEISFSASSSSLQNVIDRINQSAAGVSAQYDSINDRLVLTNKTTGDMGMALEDTSGNFLAATGLLSGGTLERGKNLEYTVNDGPTLRSQSNTISESSSGITGLNVTALKSGTVTIGVQSDTAKIKQGINDFITQYNKVQSLIDTQTASTTDSTGKVTAGVLANESDADSISSSLRALTMTVNASVSGPFKRLDDLGIISNGYDNSLSLDDETKLDSALANNLGDLKSLFTDTTNGFATQLDAYLTKVAGDDGTLAAKQSTLANQITGIDTQIADMERYVTSEKDRLTASFTAMEVAQSNINQQLQYLSKISTTTS